MKKLKKIDGSCAVCALHYVSGIDEDTVLRICGMHGFEAGQGMEDGEWMEAAKDLKIRMKSVSFEKMRLRKFKKTYSSGLFLLGTVDHLFVIDNGIVVDPRFPGHPGLDRIIRQAWRVDKAISKG